MDIKNMYNGSHAQHYDLVLLAELAGIKADPGVFRILVELLSMQVEPDAIYKVLRYIRRSKYPKQAIESARQKRSSHSSNVS